MQANNHKGEASLLPVSNDFVWSLGFKRKQSERE